MADRKLFIGNLVRRITQDDLWVMYSTFGPLEECAKFHESFGFVRFLHAEDARQALEATHGITLKGRCIKVEFAATTTSWRSANNSSCNDCRSAGKNNFIRPLIVNIILSFTVARYNIPPIRAVDFTNHRDHHHSITSPSLSYSSPIAIDPIGHRRKPKSKSGMIKLFLLRVFFFLLFVFSFQQHRNPLYRRVILLTLVNLMYFVHHHRHPTLLHPVILLKSMIKIVILIVAIMMNSILHYYHHQ